MKSKPKEILKFVNKLIGQSSPYLIQHAHNPVDWFPWGDEALAFAQKENKLIFLSIGYSTCHWCHVMEKESFEDVEVAEFLNENYVSIKVDREERPDLDQKYMEHCVMFRGSGGWPLSVWMTPSLEPIFFATYLPPKQKALAFGSPSFFDVCNSLASQWALNQEEVQKSGNEIAKMYKSTQALLYQSNNKASPTLKMRESILASFFSSRSKSFDSEWGGFDGPIKFVRPHQISAMIRLLCSGKYVAEGIENQTEVCSEMVEYTIDAVLRGGIHDHVWGGFHRYSVDKKWLVPHFEKMLYDQAGMVHLLIDAATILSLDEKKKSQYLEAAKKTVMMVYNDMMPTEEKNCFFSAQDADDSVTRKEGLWYLWNKSEIIDVLGEKDGRRACSMWGVTDEGNFEGKNILNLISKRTEKLRDADLHFLAESCEKLRKYRKKKDSKRKVYPPEVDTKVLRDWNGYMLGAVARLSSVVSDPKEREFFLQLAVNVATSLVLESDVVHCEGIAAFSTDYGFLMDGLLFLYEASFDEKWKDAVKDLGSVLISQYYDAEKNLFSMQKTITEEEEDDDLVFETIDGALPSTNSIAARALLKAGNILGDLQFIEVGKQTVNKIIHSTQMEKDPSSFTVLLSAFCEWSFDDDIVKYEISRDLADDLKILLREYSFVGTSFSISSDSDQNSVVQICSEKTCKRKENVDSIGKLREILVENAVKKI